MNATRLLSVRRFIKWTAVLLLVYACFPLGISTEMIGLVLVAWLVFKIIVKLVIGLIGCFFKIAAVLIILILLISII